MAKQEKQAIDKNLEKRIRELARSLGFSDTPLRSSGTHNIELRLRRKVSDEYVYIARFTGIAKGELQIVISKNLDDEKAEKLNGIGNIRSSQDGSEKGKPVQGTQYPGLGNKLPSGNYIGRAWRVPINESLMDLDTFLKLLLSDEFISPITSPEQLNTRDEGKAKQESGKVTYEDFGEAPDDNPNELDTFARKVRKGQPAFREKLIALYEGRCAITDASPSAVLEAAHIFDHSESGINHSDNGILLRADIHLLFDSGLLKINPDTFLVELSSSLKGTQYWELSGKQLRARADGSFPSKDYLMKKWYSQA